MNTNPIRTMYFMFFFCYFRDFIQGTAMGSGRFSLSHWVLLGTDVPTVQKEENIRAQLGIGNGGNLVAESL